MCCHYNNHSGNICQMVRDCDIHQADGDDPDYPCMMVKQQPIDDIVTAAMLVVKSRETGEIGTTRHSCHEILQHLVCPVFFDIATDGSKYSIFGCLPWELLHLYSLGIFKYLLHAVYNYQQVPPALKDWYSCRCNCNQHCSSDNLSDTGNGDIPTTKPTINFMKLSKLFKKPEFKKNIRVVQHASQQQSDCNMPRAPFHNGVTDQTRLSGQEYPGLCLITLVAMKGIPSPADPAIEKGFYNLIFMALCLEVALTQESYTESQLDQLETAIKKFLWIFWWVVKPFRECFSCCGLRIAMVSWVGSHCILYLAVWEYS